MGKRLTKITTRTGDDGTTGLGDGTRVAKDSDSIEALGDIDELNSMVGLLLTESLPEPIRKALLDVQHDLFDLGGEVCIPGHRIVGPDHISRLEGHVTEFNAHLAPLKEFILPGGSRAGALCNVARTVCRRAERRLVRMARSLPIGDLGHQYLNRLSDLLFILARSINVAADAPETYWRSRKLRSSGPQ